MQAREPSLDPIEHSMQDLGSRTVDRGSGTEDQNLTAAQERRQRGKRIPDDFTVTPDMVAWARERCPNVNGRTETEKFVNHWRSASGQNATKLDWVLTWKNWMIRAEEQASRPGTAGTQTGQVPLSQRTFTDEDYRRGWNKSSA